MKKLGCLSVLMVFLGLTFCLSFSLSAQDKKDTGETYTIKKGDTLWDISSQFLKNPFLWPKLWQRNPYITNPHWIYPGNTVRLNPMEEPKKEEPQRVAEEKPKQKMKEPEVKRIEPPADVKKAETLPEKTQAETKQEFPEVRYAGFFSDVPFQGIGEVLDSREGKNIVTPGDICYVGLKTKEPVKVGDKLTTFSAQADKFVSNKAHGKRYNITGIIQIIDQYGPFHTAKVLEAFMEISKGDRIMPYHKEKMEVGVAPR